MRAWGIALLGPVLALVVGVVASLLGGRTLATASAATRPTHTIPISGYSEFVVQVVHALDLLRDRDPAAYAKVLSHLGSVVSGPRSGVDALGDPATCWFSDSIAFSSVTYLASSLAHEAEHVRLVRDHRAWSGGSYVPWSVYSGKEAERRCIVRQAEVLRQIRAPQHEIRWVEAADGSHFDLNGNGVPDAEDFLKRDW